MNMRTISIIIGAILLTVALILSFLSSDKDVMLTKQNTLMLEYIKKSSTALENGDTHNAISLAKKAIQANPNDNRGFEAYKSAIKIKFGGSTKPKHNRHNAEDEEEEDDGLGC
jgi:Tfp pilus assembly protein PilF